jgi:glutamine synthetase
MATKRIQGYQDVLNRTPKPIEYDGKVSELFGKNVFHSEIMREYLPSDAYKSMMEAIQNGTRLDRKMADQVASAMKDWAITKGATIIRVHDVKEAMECVKLCGNLVKQ